MIIHKIPKPLTIIGEHSNKCMCYASCNFTYIGNLINKKRFLINKKTKNFYQNYIKNYPILKSSFLNYLNGNDFFSCFTSLFGGLNFLNKNNENWFNIKLNHKTNFFDYVLVFHIRRKHFKYEKIETNETFNLTVVNKMVDDAHKAYYESDYEFLGKLIDSYWRLKKQSDPNCGNNYIYKIYSDCRLAGAWGGKMDENTMFLLAPKEKHENIKNVMKENIILNPKPCTTGIITEEIFSGNSNCCK